MSLSKHLGRIGPMSGETLARQPTAGLGVPTRLGQELRLSMDDAEAAQKLLALDGVALTAHELSAGAKLAIPSMYREQCFVVTHDAARRKVTISLAGRTLKGALGASWQRRDYEMVIDLVPQGSGCTALCQLFKGQLSLAIKIQVFSTSVFLTMITTAMVSSAPGALASWVIGSWSAFAAAIFIIGPIYFIRSDRRIASELFRQVQLALGPHERTSDDGYRGCPQ